MEDNNLIWHKGYISRDYRNNLNGHKSAVIWLTGLPSSGKSTIAHEVERVLYEQKIRCYVLDGDNIRHGLNNDLGFSKKERRENIRRVAHVAKLFIDAGIIVFAAFISPIKSDRALAKEIIGRNDFFEVYVRCSIEDCMKRDPKGHYKKAIDGIIKEYTGITSPYEEPDNPDLIIDTTVESIEESTLKIINFLKVIQII